MQKSVALDAFDLRLLAALQADGQLSVQELAARVGLSASQCSRRRARLEQDGVIASYHARLDRRRLGFDVVAFVQVTLARHSPDNAKHFRALVERIPAIQQAHAVTGDADYVLKVTVRDLQGLGALVNDVLLPHASVSQVRSMVSLEQLKDTAALPIEPLR